MSDTEFVGLLSGAFNIPLYDEELESRLFELEKARLEHLSILEGQKYKGLFGLGAGYLFLQRENALLLAARERRISLTEDDWRRSVIERIAFDWIDVQLQRRERGRPRKRFFGLLGATLQKPNALLEEIENIKAEALGRGKGVLSDSKCVEIYVELSEFGGSRPRRGASLRVYEAHCRTIRNKLSKLRTTKKGTANNDA